MADIQHFIQRWLGFAGNEKSDTQLFWFGLLRDVLDVQTPDNIIQFEKPVELTHKSFIDGYIPSTGIIIEQKSPDINLDAQAKQSDGSLASPFEQAKRYYDWLPRSEKGRFIIVCNFHEIRVHDMETPKAQPEIILLSELEKEARKLAFIIDKSAQTPREIRELDMSVDAGELVGKLYDAILNKYINPNDKDSKRSLNIFCVRIVFLLYAEKSGIFSSGQFTDFLKAHSATPRTSLIELFRILDTKPELRDPYLDDDLAAFHYVNGGLFHEHNIELPKLDTDIVSIIVDDMARFRWNEINPTIFGAVFETTLNPETRHSGGMHYTSIENIHRVIDPLFLDELTKEAENLLHQEPSKAKTKTLLAFQKKISSFTFFDPACGSGNFLTETYLSLRRLENRIINELNHGQMSFAFSRKETKIQVSILQFFGIEINDFAVAVAKTAMWISEIQMWNETAKIIELVEDVDDILPLQQYDRNIIEANALFTDWGKFLPTEGALFIMSNPPFLGYSVRDERKKDDLAKIFTDNKGKPLQIAGKIDYVAGWYYRLAEFMQTRKLKAAFVSTNSVAQGEQVTYIFKTLYDRFRIMIDFAHSGFIWDSEAPEQAQVHCVVIGFDSTGENLAAKKRLFSAKGLKLVDCINFYLVPGHVVFAVPRVKTICVDVPPMITGNRPADGGNLLLTPEEAAELIRKEPDAERFIKRYMMGYEFINDVERYCLWLVDATPQQLVDMPRVMERVRKVRELRLKSSQPKLADIPHLFREQRNPKSYIAIPKTSSEKREYIPLGFLDDSVIPGNGLKIIQDATLYHFGVLTSRVHMGWMRRVCGRLKSDYRYSKNIVYNTFVWPKPSQEQKAKIEAAAQKILEAREEFRDSSLAALYDEAAMPLRLRTAHRENDKAVCEAYGWKADVEEEAVVDELFRKYYDLAGMTWPE